MRILHVIDSGGLYGAEIMLLTLVEEQLRMGLEPVIASIGERKIKEKAIEAEAVRRDLPVVSFRMHPGPNYVGARKILRYAHQKHINVLHLHGYKGNILFGFIPKQIRRLPLVTTLHGWTNTGRLTRMLLYETMDAVSLKFMDAVVLVSDQMLTHPRLRNRSALPLRVVANGIASEADQVTTTTYDPVINNFCAQGPTVGTIGRLSPEKGHEHLLNAVKALEGVFPNLQLVVIGDGRLRSELGRKAMDLGIDSRVLFAGYRDQAHSYLSLFDIFVLPSLTEGLPITLLEAMRASRPIVATAVGGMPAALEYGLAGILVPPGNSQGLVDGIRDLLSDVNKAHRIASAARNLFIKRFSSRRMAEQYADIYRAVNQ